MHLEIFVSGLPYTATEDDLREFFTTDGISEIKLPKYQDTGRCLGYSHIVYDNEEDYNKALAKNGEKIGTRYLDIKPAKGQKVEPPRKVSVPVGCKVLFIKNLPYEMTEEEIRTEFSSCGIIVDVRMVRNWANKKFKGFAYIDYRDLGSVKKAIDKYNGKPYKGRNLILDAVTTDMRKGFKKRDQTYPKEGEEYPEE